MGFSFDDNADDDDQGDQTSLSEVLGADVANFSNGLAEALAQQIPDNFVNSIASVAMPKFEVPGLDNLIKASLGSGLGNFPTLSIPATTIADNMVKNWTAIFDYQESISRSLSDQLTPIIAHYEQLLSPVYEMLRDLTQVRLPIFDFTDEERERWLRSGYPVNWDGSFDDEAATNLVTAGWPLTWVPRSEIVGELVRAEDDEARDQILLLRREELLEDCDSALSQIENEQLTFLVEMASEAVESARLGLGKVSQAGSAVLADTLCKQYFKMNSKELREHRNSDIRDLPYTRFVWGLCIVAVAMAFSAYLPESGDPTPPQYNRHASIHDANAIQYTEVNGLCALLAAVSLLCQANVDVASEVSKVPAATEA